MLTSRAQTNMAGEACVDRALACRTQQRPLPVVWQSLFKKAPSALLVLSFFPILGCIRCRSLLSFFNSALVFHSFILSLIIIQPSAGRWHTTHRVTALYRFQDVISIWIQFLLSSVWIGQRQ